MGQVGYCGLPLLVLISLGAACPPPTPPAPARPPLKGLADYHTHQFGFLGFGGSLISHGVDPTAACLPLPTYDAKTMRVRDLVLDGILHEATQQAATAQCYPTASSMASQRMATDHLRRAWSYGLRLMVMMAVNSEFLCEVAALGNTCMYDQQVIERQLQAAKDLQGSLDAAAGGPGADFYRIVHSPEEARDAISQGKLAVILGIETSNAFGCRIGHATEVTGIRPLEAIVNPNVPTPREQAWQLQCGLPLSGLEELQTQQALALFERYWELGARHFFLIHNLNGTAGGAGLSIPLLHAMNNASRARSGDLWDRVEDVDRVITEIRPRISSWNCAARFSFDGGRCNSQGLTPTGRFLVRMMASRGAIIDIDHMSWRAKRELLEASGVLGGVYPFISSHSGVDSINGGDKKNEGQLAAEDFAAMVRTGSAFAPILPPAQSVTEEATYPGGATTAAHTCGGTTESYVQAYRFVVDKLTAGRRMNGEASFVGVGFGTDFGAPVPVSAAPRFGDADVPLTVGSDVPVSIVRGNPVTGPGGQCTFASRSRGFTAANGPHVDYPFTSPLTGASFGRSMAPWGMRTQGYDVSFDGVAHTGMIPDFVEELRALGLSEDDLQPLWYGAEAYIRAWEAATSWPNTFHNENQRGIAQDCATLRRELLKNDGTYPATISRWRSAVTQLQQKKCHGFPETLTVQDLEGTWDATSYTFTNKANTSQSVDIVSTHAATMTLTVQANGTTASTFNDGQGGTSSNSGQFTATSATLTLAGTAYQASLGSRLILAHANAEYDFDGNGSKDPATLAIVLDRR